MLCYLADISSMCRLASWQAETTGALGMLSVQEIWLILINTAPPHPHTPTPCLLQYFCRPALLLFFSWCHMRVQHPPDFCPAAPSSW